MPPLLLAAVLLGYGAVVSGFDLQGHRGARGLEPENTLPAFARALSLGVTTLELDLGLTKDGVLVVGHDERLNGDLARGADGQWLSGPGPAIFSLTFAELQRYDVGRLRPGSAYAARFPSQAGRDGVRMPRLADVVALAERAGNRTVRFNVETKLDLRDPAATASPEAFADARGGLRPRPRPGPAGHGAVVRLAQPRPRARERHPRSSSRASPASSRGTTRCRRAFPDRSPGSSGSTSQAHGGSVPRLVAAAGAKVWSPPSATSPPSACTRRTVSASGCCPGRSTIRPTWHRLIGLGVDGLITDYPDRLRAVMAERGLALPARDADRALRTGWTQSPWTACWPSCGPAWSAATSVARGSAAPSRCPSRCRARRRHGSGSTPRAPRPGVYWLERETTRRLEALGEDAPAGRALQALLHVRKHLDGARVQEVRRVAGERAIVLETASGSLVLALGPVPSLTLFVSGMPLGGLGEGPPLAALPAEAPGEGVGPRLGRGGGRGRAGGAARRARALSVPCSALCPGLSPRLVREAGETPEEFERLRARLRSPRPTLLAPGPAGAWTGRGPGPRRRDSALAVRSARSRRPWSSTRPRGPRRRPSSSRRGAADPTSTSCVGAPRPMPGASRIGSRSSKPTSCATSSPCPTRPSCAATARPSWPPPPPGRRAPRRSRSRIPYDPSRVRRVAVDPALGGPQSADRLFTKARRIERARRQVEARLARHAGPGRWRAREARRPWPRPRNASDLPRAEPARARPRDGRPERAGASASTGPRHYLTSRGLSVLVGRGARENHHLTFTVAGPDDLWLHARDVPGAHVILKDPEGRAGAEDLREAAEIAAFFSDASGVRQGRRPRHPAQARAGRARRPRPRRPGPHRDPARGSPRSGGPPAPPLK